MHSAVLHTTALKENAWWSHAACPDFTENRKSYLRSPWERNVVNNEREGFTKFAVKRFALLVEITDVLQVRQFVSNYSSINESRAPCCEHLWNYSWSLRTLCSKTNFGANAFTFLWTLFQFVRSHHPSSTQILQLTFHDYCDWIQLAWNNLPDCEISGSHGGEYEDGCLLGCCAL
jgi:hypothetical protein